MIVIIGIRSVDKTRRKNKRNLNSSGIVDASGTPKKIIPNTKVGISKGWNTTEIKSAKALNTTILF
jgi:hypothetical protein